MVRNEPVEAPSSKMPITVIESMIAFVKYKEGSAAGANGFVRKTEQQGKC
jgi:hypothetical protein